MPNLKHGLDYLLDSNDSERRSAVSRLDLIGGFDESALKKQFESAFPELATKLDYAVVACNFSLNKNKPVLYLTMGIELKETGAEEYNQKIEEWLERIYDEKIIEAQKAVTKKIAHDNGFGEEDVISNTNDTNEFEKSIDQNKMQKIKINVSCTSSEEDETLGLDLKSLGIGSYAVDAFYLDKKFYFCVEHSIITKRLSKLQKIIKVIVWVPKKILDFFRNLIYGKESDKEKRVITLSGQTANKTEFGSKKRICCGHQPKMEENEMLSKKNLGY